MTEKIKSTETENAKDTNPVEPVTKDTASDTGTSTEGKDSKVKLKEITETPVDYETEINRISGFDISRFLDYFSDTVNKIDENTNVAELSKFIEEIKTLFYKKHHFFIAIEKKKWIQGGGNPDDFKLKDNDDRERFDDIYTKFKSYRKVYNEKLEAGKKENQKHKLEIIEKIRNLVHTEESLNSTFNTFKSLEKKWKEIGQVPAQNAKEIWESYNFVVEQFYDFIKINKELRDLDQKKNYDEKILLCEAAEALSYKDQPVKAFKELQSLHEKWKNIGPVPPEEREKIWERFSATTSIINKAHTEFHLKRKEQEEENLKAKTILCEKAEAIASENYERFSMWKKQQEQLKTLDAEWRTIGRVPRQHNVSVYQRFRDAFNLFFDKKKIFYKKNKDKEEENLAEKIKLCEAAEKWQDSEDFGKATSEILKLQEKWKETGPAPRNKSEEVWQRFRLACNHFFDRKAAIFKAQKEKEKENLKEKEILINKIKSFKPFASDKENLAAIKEFQKRWDEIGFVPRNKANDINTSYHKILTKLFESANIDKVKQQIMSYIQYLKNKQDTSGFKRFLEDERYNIRKKLQEIEKEIYKIENSLSRFSVSKGSEGFLKAYADELEKKKELKEILNRKIQLVKKHFDQLLS